VSVGRERKKLGDMWQRGEDLGVVPTEE